MKKIMVIEWNDDVQATLTGIYGDQYTSIFRSIFDVCNGEGVPFGDELKRITELVEPLGMFRGDTTGGFASGTKWHNEDKTLYLSWNTWHNQFMFFRRDRPKHDEHGYPVFDDVVSLSNTDDCKRIMEELYDKYLVKHNGVETE